VVNSPLDDVMLHVVNTNYPYYCLQMTYWLIISVVYWTIW